MGIARAIEAVAKLSLSILHKIDQKRHRQMLKQHAEEMSKLREDYNKDALEKTKEFWSDEG